MAPFVPSFVELWKLLRIGLLTTEIQWIFSGGEGVLKSCIGKGHPSPLVSHLFIFLAHKGSMHALLFLAPFQRFLDVIWSYYITFFGRINGPSHALFACLIISSFGLICIML